MCCPDAGPIGVLLDQGLSLGGASGSADSDSGHLEEGGASAVLTSSQVPPTQVYPLPFEQQPPEGLAYSPWEVSGLTHLHWAGLPTGAQNIFFQESPSKIKMPLGWGRMGLYLNLVSY